MKIVGLLNCNLDMPFWVKWYDGQFAIGTGNTIDTNAIVTYAEPIQSALKIHAIALASKEGATATFRFLRSTSK